MYLKANPTWPKSLGSRHAKALSKIMLEEELVVGRLISSVSVSPPIEPESRNEWNIMIHGIALDEYDGEWDFKAYWVFDWNKASSPGLQYRLDTIDIVEV